MTLFIDNDALLKLANYDLLDTALTMFGIRPDDIHVLATAKYALLPAKDRLRHCKTDESANRLETFLSKASKLNAECVDSEVLDALSAKPGIDPGEALMLAMATSDSDSYIVTGDKRALEALHDGKALDEVRSALAGRLLSLELLFLFLVEGDFERVQACVRGQPGVDKALTNAFGVSAPASSESVRAALNSYVEHLRRLTGALLHPSPTSS
ncbi:MAG: hypothetical protein PHY45_01155 [Rhodocyclaceae bacterium]|nr:hypothetical protein [Rhodocyclaceae bacterium]